MRKLIFTIFIFTLLFTVSFPLFAQEKQEKIGLKFFYSPTCPHCAQEEEFLNDLEKKYPNLEIERYSSFEKENNKLLRIFYEEYDVSSEDRGLVPITFLGERYFLGFNERIAEKIEQCISDLTEGGNNQNCKEQDLKQGVSSAEIGREINLPFIGKINISKLSLLTLAIIFGTLDGFNPCAMVALGFLLAVLVATGLRRRIFLIGGTFILVSGIVYFLFISAWLNLFLVLEQIKFITYIVGIIIVFFSIFLLKEYFHGIVCKLCQIEPDKENIFTRFERVLFERLKNISESKMALPFILGGVAAIAAGVNLVELVCSFGFPLAFTKILSSQQLSSLSYYSYLLIYIIFYMIDDFLIFLVALFTLKMTNLSQKYLKTVKLISGILLLVLGLVMIFYPELLAFS